VSRGATTVFTLLLARLLAPEAFGLIAMATVVFELANVFIQSGLRQALIRSKSVSDADLNTAFYTNLLLSALAYAILFVGSHYVADFYSQPELTNIVRVMGLIVFINATKVVQIAVLSRTMDFKSQMKANTLGAVGSGILAIYTAYLGWGVWSLAVMMLSQALISSIFLWLAGKWWPALEFSTESFIRLFRFGRNLLAEGIVEVLFQNSYVLVIGRFFSVEVTGLYFLAKKISNLVSQQLTSAIQQATFPALSTLQDDNDTLRRKYRQIMQLMMFIIAPVMALLTGLASPLFELVLDERWQAAVPYLQLLCVVGVLYPLHALNINLLNVKGRSDLVLKLGLIKKTVNITLLFSAIPYGVTGIIVSQIIGTALALIPNTYFSDRLIGYSLLTQVSDIAKPMVSATIAGIFTWWLSQKAADISFTWLLAFGVIGCLVYVGISLAIKAEGASMLWSKIKQVL